MRVLRGERHDGPPRGDPQLAPGAHQGRRARRAAAGPAGHRAARRRGGGAVRRRAGAPAASPGPRLAAAPSAPARCRTRDAADVRWRFESARSVLPEDTLFGNLMFPGKLLMDIDEAGGILSHALLPRPRDDRVPGRARLLRADLHARGGDVQGRAQPRRHSSLEVGVKVLTEQPHTGEMRHACTAYLTFVHLGPDLRPRPCPPFTPETPAEQRRWARRWSGGPGGSSGSSGSRRTRIG